MRVTEEELLVQFSKAVADISISDDFKEQLLKTLNEVNEKSKLVIKR